MQPLVAQQVSDTISPSLMYVKDSPKQDFSINPEPIEDDAPGYQGIEELQQSQPIQPIELSCGDFGFQTVITGAIKEEEEQPIDLD